MLRAIPAAANERTVINLMPALLPLIGRNDYAATRSMRRSIFEKENRLYRSLLRCEPETIRDSAIARYLVGLQPLSGRLQQLSSSLPLELDAVIARLHQRFPDFRSDFTSYFLPSFGRFDAETRPFDGARVALFGVDTIAASDAAVFSFPVVATHEVFHMYHYDVTPDLGPREAFGLRLPLWREGLATFASMQMTAGASETVALIDAMLAGIRPAETARLAARFITERNAGTDADTWFCVGLSPSAVPPRAGYLLGLRVVQILARDRDLDTLTAMRGEELLQSIDRALRELAQRY